jgi:uncharacterized protein DUF6983
VSQTVPTLPLPFYTLRTRLDDSDYTLEFNYSPRAERYYLNLYSSEDVLLVAGLKLVPGVLLLRYYKYRDGMPQGELVVTATGADGSPPKLGELGRGLRCELSYFTVEELKANRQAAEA